MCQHFLLLLVDSRASKVVGGGWSREELTPLIDVVKWKLASSLFLSSKVVVVVQVGQQETAGERKKLSHEQTKCIEEILKENGMEISSGNVRCFLPLKTSCSSEKIKRKNNTRGGRRENSTVIFAVALCWGIILHEKDHNIMQIKHKTICLIQYSVIYRIYERERAVITFWVVSLVLYKRNNTEKGIFAKTERQLFGGPASLSTALAIVTSSDAKTK